MNFDVFLCTNCHRIYDSDGWEVGKAEQGNNYTRAIIGWYNVRITNCICGLRVVVQNVSEADKISQLNSKEKSK